MHKFFAGWAACALLCACANAEPPGMAAPMPIPAIVDAEPDVTQQVSALLGQLGQGTLAPDQLTDNARAALGASKLAAMGSALRACGAGSALALASAPASAPALDLLRRSTKGEDRQYLYRIPCDSGALLVDIDFNKGAKINRLVVRQQ